MIATILRWSFNKHHGEPETVLAVFPATLMEEQSENQSLNIVMSWKKRPVFSGKLIKVGTFLRIVVFTGQY